MVEISMLGSGSGMNPDLGNTSFLVSENEGPKVLVDFGFTNPRTLSEKNALKDLEHVAITHTHSDHVGGLELFGFFKMFAPDFISGKKPTLYLPSDKMAHTLWEHTLRGGMGFPDSGPHKFAYDGLQMDVDRPMVLMGETGLEVHGRDISSGTDLYTQIYGQDDRPMTIDDYFNVKTGKDHKINGKTLNFFQTPHTRGLENYGLRITTNDANVFYSGDTIALPGKLPDDVIIQDLQFPDFNVDFKSGKVNPNSVANAHATLREATLPEYMDYIGQEQMSRTYFTHLWAEHKKPANDPMNHGYGGFILPGDHISVRDHKVNLYK